MLNALAADAVCQQAVQPIHVQDVLQLVLLLTVGAALALG